MLPSVVASQVRSGVEDYLRATFPIGSASFSTLWEDFFARDSVLFRGPYYTLQLPFRSGGSDYAFPSGMKLGFSPYRHQERAFERLCGARGASALVATGTGSGKTECFLYPLLDCCLAHKGEKGVKAIVVYPMNALATDQAKRFAKEIDGRPELRGNVRVGLYVGGQKDSEGATTMWRKEDGNDPHVITNKKALRENPPDILLTNYKELDYLLVRARDWDLWRENKPETLRYVVVDELHTFDGAQGADLACLLRRVYARLHTSQADVNRVGTSATLGSGLESTQRLLDFARNVFGGEFEQDSVITEDLVDPLEFAPDDPNSGSTHLREEDFDVMDPDRYDSQRDYLQQQAFAWLENEYGFLPGDDGERVKLGGDLARLGVFRELLKAASGKTLDSAAMAKALGATLSVLTTRDGRYVSEPLCDRPKAERERAIQSLFALVSYARRAIDDKGGTAPFLRVRVELWLRETARLAASLAPLPRTDAPDCVELAPRLDFLSNVSDEEESAFLPIVHCRSCGRIGYVSFELNKSEKLSRSISDIYRLYFSHAPNVVHVYFQEPGEAFEKTLITTRVCPYCLTIERGSGEGACPKCGKPMRIARVEYPNAGGASGGKGWHRCPICDSTEVAIVGARAASLTSSALSLIFGSKYNDDKKVLAFSDSVQDASHRAGFFVGRSFRYTMRAAIAQYLDALGGAPSFDKVVDGFADYWIERFAQEEAKRAGTIEPDKQAQLRAQENFIVQFLPADKQDWRYDKLKREGTALKEIDDYLLNTAKLRSRYEIVAEFARLSQIGRTLEKSQAAIAALAPELRERWIEELALELREKIGGLRGVDLDALKARVGRFILQTVRAMRLAGGVYLDSLSVLFNDGDGFKNNRKFWFMPHLLHDRQVRFVQAANQFKDFDSLVRGKRPKVYAAILRSTLGSATDGYGDDVYTEFLRTGTALGILIKSAVAEVWGLDPRALVVETQVDRYLDSESKNALYAPECERKYWSDAPYVEPGGDPKYPRTLALDASDAKNYYRSLYKSTDICRIVAREHTGLLERSKREALENEFIAGTAQNVAATNALSCTPTLEMGVNIGDLSCVALCSMPPSRASYVQRVGRGGRRDGNSFNLVIATNRPRDLYFFNSPEEAIAGPVDPPGVFLNAPAVLERQTIAYAFDRWIDYERGEAKNAEWERLVPWTLSEVFNLNKKAPDKSFPQTFFDFVAKNRDSVFNSFCEMFGDALRPSTKDALREFFYNAEDGGFEWNIAQKLQLTKEARDKYDAGVKKIRDQIADLKKKAQDDLVKKAQDDLVKEELRELEIERATLVKAREQIDRKTTYEYLTDEGLLPNYAFPEEGMTLRSALWSKSNDKNGERSFTTKSDEYARAARSALGELAPGNTFYADGRKLTVNRIDTASKFVVEKWRFCGECSYVHEEKDGETASECCPRCGSPTWGDGSLRRNVLRLDRVVAEQEEESTRAFDESDEREYKRYERRTLVRYGDADREGVKPDAAYELESADLAFGFEFWSKANFRDVNFGERTDEDRGTIAIAGTEVPSTGFVMCKECGATLAAGEKEIRHAPGCRYRKKTARECDGALECLFLYRQFDSEALRMAIPVDTRRKPAFIAAIDMALQEYFRGDVGHLHAIEQDDSVSNSKIRQDFLTIYDEVPGGTGYLKQFAEEPNAIFRAMKTALERLEKCPCEREPDKDGCYRCILAYAQGKDAAAVKRSDAIEILKELLNAWKAQGEKVKEIESLKKIDYATSVESKLEQDFIDLFYEVKNDVGADPRVSIEKTLDRGEQAYDLTVGTRKYRMRCQKTLGAAQGIALDSRADFEIRPLRPNDGARPIAVFTDGFDYHGNPNGTAFRLADDAKKRTAILRAENEPYLCWSLTYDDVEEYRKGKDYLWTPCVSSEPKPLKSLPDVGNAVLPNAKLGAFDRLLAYLAKPDDALFKQFALASAAGPEKEASQVFMSAEDAKAFWNSLADGDDPDSLVRRANAVKQVKTKDAYVVLFKRPNDRVSIVAFAPVAAYLPGACGLDAWENARAAVLFDDESPIDERDDGLREYRKAWNTWLAAYDLVQFIPGAVLASRKAFLSGYAMPDWDDLPRKKEEEADDEFGPDGEDWRAALEDFPDAETVLRDAFAKGWEPPESYWDLSDGKAIVGNLPVAWIERKVFWTDDSEAATTAQDLGWTPYAIENNNH